MIPLYPQNILEDIRYKLSLFELSLASPLISLVLTSWFATPLVYSDTTFLSVAIVDSWVELRSKFSLSRLRLARIFFCIHLAWRSFKIKWIEECEAERLIKWSIVYSELYNRWQHVVVQHDSSYRSWGNPKCQKPPKCELNAPRRKFLAEVVKYRWC